jgi:CxxC-x17-CxxC domain-containing protein
MKMEFEEKTLVCEDCGEEWTFSADEQQFFDDRGYQTPKRCKPCRQRRKMSGNSSRGFERRELYTVTCADCGDEAQVPFQPSGDRPVYCRDCYQKHR